METTTEGRKTNTKVELAVELTCQNCVTKTENVLSKVKEIEDFKVNLDKQSVVITSALPSSKLGVKIRNLKVDFKTGGTWCRFGQ